MTLDELIERLVAIRDERMRGGGKVPDPARIMVQNGRGGVVTLNNVTLHRGRNEVHLVSHGHDLRRSGW